MSLNSSSRDSFPDNGTKSMYPFWIQIYFGYKPVIVIQIKDNCLHTCLSYIWMKENTIARDNEYTFEPM